MKHFILICLFTISTFVQAAEESKSGPTNTYVSETDRNLVVKRIGILPITDNVKGIYARTIETKLASLIKQTHRFDLTEVRDIDSKLTYEDFVTQPEVIKSLKSKTKAEAVLAAKLMKSGQTVDYEITLLLIIDGLPLIQESITNQNRFDTADIQNLTEQLYTKLLAKFPYKGLVLSRQGNRVTMDIGTRDGIKNFTVITAEQILALNRHPKFRFVLSTEKEIIGKIKIVKADETLSFGVVVQEKQKGVVVPMTKLSGLDYVSYEETSAQTPKEEFLKDTVSFGNHPKEWIPEKTPTLGRLGATLGLGTYRYSTSLTSGQSPSGYAPIYPQLSIDGEIWLTPAWLLGAILRQGILSFSNPLGGTPATLSARSAHYDLHVGYRFLLQDDFWGPRINMLLGFSKHDLFVDASTPLAFTSTSYSGLYLGLGGDIPLDARRTYYLNANLTKHLVQTLAESPNSSGATAENSITAFGFGGSHKLNSKFWIKVALEFEFYSTTFSGSGTRATSALNSSQSLTTLFGGIDYYF